MFPPGLVHNTFDGIRGILLPVAVLQGEVLAQVVHAVEAESGGIGAAFDGTADLDAAPALVDAADVATQG